MDEFIRSKKTSYVLKNLSTKDKNNALLKVSESLKERYEEILQANKIDVDAQKSLNVSSALIDRLMLNKERIFSIANDILKVIDLPEYTNVVLDEWTASSGIKIKKVSVPFGVIGVIYEARPNVTVDVFSLCLKTGNACLLKGGSNAKNSNEKIVEIIRNALKETNVLEDSIILLPSTRESTENLIKAKKYVDLLIPRGSKSLIEYVTQNATVPVIETGAGVCHTYISKNADIDMAIKILVNAKTSRPSVCNACETLIIDRSIAKEVLKLVENTLTSVTFYGTDEERKYINCLPLKDLGYYTEYDNLELSIKIVDNYIEAVEHINTYGTHHSDCICSKNNEEIEYFLNNVDSACVYANASTRFSDGGCFGFGAEIGISTQKQHSRGPMGLKEITTYQYKIYGNGEIR